MRKHLSGLFLLMLFFSTVIAQERTVTGTVRGGEDNLPLPGVSIRVKGTTVGTQSGPNGQFSVQVSVNRPVLTFSYIGYISRDVTVSSTAALNVVLQPDQNQLGEVVVTALGVQRSKNELPYAAQQVGGEEVTRNRGNNFVNSLSGKVAGLDIRQGNSLGGSTNVIIRGYKSITGNNQALYVIDGVPVGNITSNTGTTNTNDAQMGRGGYDYGNPVSDINPDDIQSVNVLKGAAATALYGSRAANGVILITTKKGRMNATSVVVNSGVTFGTIDKETFVKYQKRYGAGYSRYDYESPDGRFLYRDVNGDGQNDLITPFSEDASFGAAFDPNLLVHQWDSFDPFSPTYQIPTPWVAAENSPDYLYETAVSSNQNVIISGGGETGTFKIGYTRNDDKGVLPNSKLTKDMFNLAASYNIAKNLTATADVNYSNTAGLGRYGTGYSGLNPNQPFRQWFQTNVDVKQLKDAYFRNGQNITWNWTSPSNLRPIYTDNPYWTRYENYQNDSRNRYFGYTSLSWKPLEWFDVLGRVSIDGSEELQEERIAVGSADVAEYRRYNRRSKEMNFDLLLNFNKDISSDLTFKGLLGSNLRRVYWSSVDASTNGGLVIPGLYSLTNSVSALIPPVENDVKIGVDGIFASATFGYKDMLFLDLTARNDVSTTLPTNDNSFFYSAVSGSFVFSKLLTNYSWLSSGKVRLNYAEVGNDAPALSVYDVYDVPTGLNGAPIFSVPSTKNNAMLKPERTKSIEAGLDADFLEGRFGFDFTWYKTNTLDQIMPVNVTAATGYTTNYVNAGEVRNIGVELSMFFTPVRRPDFSWTTTVNFARNRNKVLSLYQDVQNIPLFPIGFTSLQGGVTVNAAVGYPMGIIRGTDYIYDEASGQPTVNSDGYYMAGSTNDIIGDPNPDWTGGVNNAFRYKDFALNFLIDIRKGGDIWSLDQWYGQGTGLYPNTAQLNDLGNPSRLPAAEGGGVILPGVKEDGTPNDIRVENYDGYVTPYGYPNNPPRASAIFDGSFVKLREVALRYSLPDKLISKLRPFKAVDISLLGRNLWIIHKNLPYADPEDALSSGNIRGYQSGSYPTVRTYGFNVRFTL